MDTCQELWFKSTLLFVKATFKYKKVACQNLFNSKAKRPQKWGYNTDLQTDSGSVEEHLTCCFQVKRFYKFRVILFLSFLFFPPPPPHLLQIYGLSKEKKKRHLNSQLVRFEWMWPIRACALVRWTCLFWGVGGGVLPHGKRVLLLRLQPSVAFSARTGVAVAQYTPCSHRIKLCSCT